MAISKDKLEYLKNLAKNATPGPWNLKIPKETNHKGYGICDSKDNLILFHVRGFDDWPNGTLKTSMKVKKANAAYLAAIDPNTVLELIAEIERLQAYENPD